MHSNKGFSPECVLKDKSLGLSRVDVYYYLSFKITFFLQLVFQNTGISRVCVCVLGNATDDGDDTLHDVAANGLLV